MITRRRLLFGVVSVGATGLGWLGWTHRFSLQLFLRMRSQDGRPELYPSEPGSLSEAEGGELWGIVRVMAEHWRLEGLTREEFDRVLALKTQQAPSYLREYRSALALLGELRRDAGSPLGGILELLRASPRDGEQFTAHGHAQAHVIEEFVRLQLARGGFRPFGLTNHPGYAGGATGYPLADLSGSGEP